jgi:Ca2+-binding RTX toxin-like protein
MHGSGNSVLTDTSGSITADDIRSLMDRAPQGTLELSGGVDVTGSAADFHAIDMTRFLPRGSKGYVDALTSSGTLDMRGVHMNLVLRGSTGADTLIGGDRNDEINSNGGADVLTGGAGDDTFYAGLGVSSLSQMMQITDFTPGQDSFKAAYWVPAASNVGSTVVQADNTRTLAEVLGGYAAANTVGEGVIVFLYQGDAYLYHELVGSGTSLQANDLVIKLTGGAGLRVGDAFLGWFV